MISIIVPFYNSEQTIVAALESVKRQTWSQTDFQLILINDGSVDNSVEIVQSFIKNNPEFEIRLISQENKGVSSARNAGLKVAKGDYIAFLDSDDEWLPEKTIRQLDILQKENIDFLACRRGRGNIMFPYVVKNGLAKITFNKLLVRNETQPSTVIFKREILEDTDLFDPNQRYAEDVNYWMKISRQHTMYILDENLVILGDGKRSFGVKGLSANLLEMHRGFLKNILEMYQLGYINIFQLKILQFFYRGKYLFLRTRHFFYQSLG